VQRLDGVKAEVYMSAYSSWFKFRQQQQPPPPQQQPVRRVADIVRVGQLKLAVLSKACDLI
jgi:hypothetical protein